MDDENRYDNANNDSGDDGFMDDGDFSEPNNDEIVDDEDEAADELQQRVDPRIKQELLNIFKIMMDTLVSDENEMHLLHVAGPKLFDLMQALSAETLGDAIARYKYNDKTGIDFIIRGIRVLGPRNGIFFLHILWSISALWQHKGACFDKGAVHLMVEIADNTLKSDQLMAVATVIQNLSEHIFHNAERNPNQVKILQTGVLEKLPIFLASPNTFIRFIACNTLANLSVCEANKDEIVASGLLRHLTDFTRNKALKDLGNKQIYGSWLGLGPHTGLLGSDIEEVQEFALFNLCQFADPSRKKQYGTMLWRDLSMVDGPVRIQDLAEHSNEHVANLAKRLLTLLDLTPKYPVIRNPKASALKTSVHFSDSGLFGNEEFSDVRLGAEEKSLPAHKVILASRCPYFKAMFSSGLSEASNRVIVLPNISFDTLYAVVKFIYTGTVSVSVSSAVDLIECADMFRLPQLRETCEFFLLQYVDHDNVISLHQVASHYNCNGLRRFCIAFISRNIAALKPTEDWAKLSAEEQAEILSYNSFI